MRIAFVVAFFPAISETFVLSQMTGFIDDGHQVDVYAHSRPRDEAVHEDVIQYNLLFRTFYFGDLLAFLKGGFRGFPEPAFFVRLWLRLKVWVFFLGSQDPRESRRGTIPRNQKYDLIICHFGGNGDNMLFLRACGLFHGKMVVFFHGYDMSRAFRRNGENAYEGLFKRVEFFLPISEFWKKKFVNSGYDARKIRVHRMGIDCRKFKAVAGRIRENKEDVEILTVCRLVEKKGVEYAIKAVAQLVRKGYRVSFKIVGDGPLKNDLQFLIDQLGVGERVRILGSMGQEEIVALLRSADIFVAPSVKSTDGDMEGIPVSLMEAMACGLPVVATRHSGIPELVRNKDCGFLVPEKDIALLAEKLEVFVLDPEKRLKMGARGRKIVEMGFDVRLWNRKLIEMARELSGQ